MGRADSASKGVVQYLSRYARDEAARLRGFDRRYARALIVPAHRESAALMRGYDSALEAAEGRTLVIVVVNAPADVAEQHASDHGRLIASLAGDSSIALETRPPMHLATRDSHDCLVIDRALPASALPLREGVGLARRVGCDVALALHARGQLDSPWLYTTDADARLPPDYFGREARVPAAAVARVFAFEHVPGRDPAIDAATARYELQLRYYVASLAEAGSPYAFHTIGSTIAVHARHYAAVRGFPRRRAGEDFYLLGKLAKVGAIFAEHGAPVQLRSRASLRTPHGTGKAALDISRLADPDALPFYHPEIFRLLARWLRWLEVFARDPRGADAVDEVSLRSLGDARLEAVLGRLGAASAIADAARATSPGKPLARRLHGWFDAFRTLKLVHALRDGGLRSLPLRDALAQTKWMDPELAERASVGELTCHLRQVETRRSTLFGASFHIG